MCSRYKLSLLALKKCKHLGLVRIVGSGKLRRALILKSIFRKYIGNWLLDGYLLLGAFWRIHLRDQK